MLITNTMTQIHVAIKHYSKNKYVHTYIVFHMLFVKRIVYETNKRYYFSHYLLCLAVKNHRFFLREKAPSLDSDQK